MFSAVLRWARRHPILTVSGLVIVAFGAAVGVWLTAPLFFSKTVIEEFPRAALAAEIPADMTAEEVEMKMQEAEATDTAASEEMPGAAAATAVSTGQFRDADSFHQGSGTATIYLLEDGSHFLRLESLNVTNGPDLHVILSPNPDPTSREEVSEPGYADLGGLKGNIGDQNYEIPNEVDVSRQMSVVIYCKPFHVIFSVATLEPAG